MSGAVRLTLQQWWQARDAARAVRYQVFCVEQKIPVELEWDDKDESSRHCLAFAASGECVGTGRLLPDGHIGRMAVLADWRGQGVGGAMLETLIDCARELGHPSVVLNSQADAVEFYLAHGFAPEGEPYQEAGIPHLTMRRVL